MSKKDKAIDAPHVSVHTIINQLPDQSKRMVLYTLVGSLNSHIINTAQQIVGRLTRDGVEFKDYSISEVEHMLLEPDFRNDLLLNTRRAVSVAQGLRDQLIELTNDDAVGSISDAIDFRCRPAPTTRLNFDKFKAVAIASRLVKSDVKDDAIELLMTATEERQRQDNQRSAERTSSMRGGIEWVIDHVFNPDTGFEQPDNIEDLHKELRAQLYDNLRARLETERLAAVSELMSSRRTPRYTISDVTLLADCADMADNLDAHVEEATID